METEAVVTTPTPEVAVSVPDPDQSFIDELFGDATPPIPAVTDTPEVKAADLSPAKEEEAVKPVEGEADGEHVQLSKSEYMRLMTLEAQQKLAQPGAPKAEAEATVTTEVAKAPELPAVKPDWTPEVTPLPVEINDDWQNVFAFESKDQGNKYIGALVNVPYQKAAEYTQNAVAAVESRMLQQINAITTNFGLFSAVHKVLEDRPEYRGEHMAQVEYAAKEALTSDPTLTAWDLPEAIMKRLDESATKAKQIIKSNGKISAVPQGGLKAGSTGARSPQDNGRSEPTVDADLQFARDLGFPG